MSTPAFVALGLVLAVIGAAVFGLSLAVASGDGPWASRAIGGLLACVGAALAGLCGYFAAEALDWPRRLARWLRRWRRA